MMNPGISLNVYPGNPGNVLENGLPDPVGTLV